MTIHKIHYTSDIPYNWLYLQLILIITDFTFNDYT